MYYQNSEIIKYWEIKKAILYTSLYDNNSQMQAFKTGCNNNNKNKSI